MQRESTAVQSRAWHVAAKVPDPEIPVVSIEDLGILRDVTEDDMGRVHVQITPTYSGCPAMETIRADLIDALMSAGYRQVAVEFVMSPAWSTDDITEQGRQRLRAFGIAPPTHGAQTGPLALPFPRRRGAGSAPLHDGPTCPQCGSHQTTELSRFGSTACKSLWRCTDCREPFDHFKPL